MNFDVKYNNDHEYAIAAVHADASFRNVAVDDRKLQASSFEPVYSLEHRLRYYAKDCNSKVYQASWIQHYSENFLPFQLGKH